MNLSDILSEETICTNLKQESKEGVIREMASLLAAQNQVEDVEALVSALMAREQIQTTGIGHGMAIPHATAKGVKGLNLVLGISRRGVEFESLDNQPVRLIFLLAGEPRLQTSFLSILSKISRFFRQETFRRQVLDAETSDEIIKLIRFREEQ
jgi:fructose-specific phosphotransferase system IIA component